MRLILLIFLSIFFCLPVYALPEDVVPIDDDHLYYENPIGTVVNISDGYYYIHAFNGNRVLTVKDGSLCNGANIFIQKYDGTNKQKKKKKKMSDGTYLIKNIKSNKVFETKGGSIMSGANVEQGTNGNLACQRWHIIRKDNTYIFQNAATSKVLTVENNKNVDKANIIIKRNQNLSGQKFTLKCKRKLNTVRKYKTSSRPWDAQKDLSIMVNIIGAVESGGQIYGKRDYTAYADPYTATQNEVTITLGWSQCFGPEAQKLVKMIYQENKKKKKKIDTKKLIVNALKKNWTTTKWKPTSAEKKILIKLISSDIGRKCQDELFKKTMKEYIQACQKQYTKNAWAVHMYCEICHLGGSNAVRRIFERCGNDYSLDSIMNALKKDQANGNGSEVGDEIFWSRHEKCCEFLQKYAE